MTLPEDVVEEAERLTVRARAAADEAEAEACRERRAALLEDHGFVARVREDESGPTLVCHPADWIVDGMVEPDRIETTDRAVERHLGGADPDADWEDIEAHNRAIAERIANEHGPAHGANAHAFADYMSNHLARRMETATPADHRVFLTDYYPRNAWPEDSHRAVVERTLELIEESV